LWITLIHPVVDTMSTTKTRVLLAGIVPVALAP
jgi:hypothetical protein